MNKKIAKLAIGVMVFVLGIFIYSNTSKNDTQAEGNEEYWVTMNSYLVVSNNNGELTLKEYIRNVDQNNLGEIKPTNINNYNNTLNGKLVETEEKITLDFNDDKDEMTLIRSNEKPVTYKSTDVPPIDYVSNYNQ